MGGEPTKKDLQAKMKEFIDAVKQDQQDQAAIDKEIERLQATKQRASDDVQPNAEEPEEETTAQETTPGANKPIDPTPTKDPEPNISDLSPDERRKIESEGEEIKEEVKNFEELRAKYFSLRINGKMDDELSKTEEEYNDAKKEIVENLLNSENGKEKVRDFLLTERELLRKSDIEKGLEKGAVVRISKGIESWNNFGKESGVNGYTKRLAKMSLSMVLIGGIASVSVQKAAELGIGTATALSGGLTSYLTRKLGIGLSMGSLMELSTSPKAKKVMQLGITALSAGAAIASGAWLAAGVSMGVSMGLGYGVSKLTKGVFDKKIENRKKEINDKIDLETINEDIIRMENEMDEVLKKNEKTRLWSKLTEAVTGITTNIVALEISGHFMDARNEAQEQEKHRQEIENKEEIKRAEDLVKEKNQRIEGLRKEIEAKLLKDATVHKRGGVESSFIKQIENNKILAEKLGYDGEPNDTKALHQFAEREAHIIAIKEGYVDNHGNEVRVAEADKIAYQIKINTNNQISVEEKDATTGAILDTHHEGDKFGENVNKYEYKSNPIMEARAEREELENLKEIMKFKAPVINPNEEINYNELNNDKIPPTIDEYVGPESERPHPVVEPTLVNHNDNIEIRDKEFSNKFPTNNEVANTHHISNEQLISVMKDIQGKEYTPETWSAAPENVYHISLDQLKEIKEIYNHNLNSINTEVLKTANPSDYNERNEIINKINAGFTGNADAFTRTQIDEVKDIYKPIHQYVNRLVEVSGLHPVEGTVLTKAESTMNFIERALMKAEHDGNLDKVKIENFKSHLDSQTIPEITKPEHSMTNGGENTEFILNNHDNANHSSETIKTYDNNIIIPWNKHFPGVRNTEVYFDYDNKGEITEWKIENKNLFALGYELFKDDFGKTLAKTREEYYKENHKYGDFSITRAEEEGKSLYQLLAAYSSFKENPNYTREAYFLENIIRKDLSDISKNLGDIIDKNKLPKEFQK